MSFFPLRDWHFVALANGDEDTVARMEADADPAVFTDLHSIQRVGEDKVEVSGKLSSTCLGDVEQCLEGLGLTTLIFIEAE